MSGLEAWMVGRKIIQVGNICALCQGTYPRSILYTCSLCGLAYCGNCILLDDDRAICLRCAVKMVSPRARRSKYMKLAEYLARRPKALNEVTLTFHEIEEIIGDRLPDSARVRRSWWSNVRGRMPSEAWLTVGWAVREVDLVGERVKFVRESRVERFKEGRELEGVSPSFKALAFKVRAGRWRGKKISKTKIAILQARLKNIERQRKKAR
ncbi:MAG: hypothetical protein QXJ19_03510 [Candidatus Bathyarchaeia archaeon]